MKKSLIMAAIFSLLNNFIAHAQAVPEHEQHNLLTIHDTLVDETSSALSLGEILERVLQNYPAIQARRQDLEGQQLQKTLVKKRFLPDINFQAQQAFGSVQNIPGSFFPLPGIFTTSGISRSPGDSPGAGHMYSSALLNWDFIQFGRKKKQLDREDASIALYDAALKEEEWKTLSAATRVYFQSLASIAFLQNAKEETVRLSELFELVKAQSEAGLRPGADTFLVKASILDSRAKESEQQALLITHFEQLSMLTGIDASSIQLDTSFFYRFANASPVLSTPSHLHPYLQSQESMVRLAQAEKAVVKKEVYPSIGLMVGAGTRGSGIDVNGQLSKSFGAPWQNAGHNYLAGIGITWKFSSLYENGTRKAIADRAIASAEAMKENTRLQLQSQYKASVLRLENEKQKLRSAASSLKASREAYALYEVRYKSGLLSLIELLQLQKNLREAESNYVKAVDSTWTEWLRYSESLGDPTLINALVQP